MVVSLPDARKGERLVLMTTDAALKRDALLRHARARGAAELMVPADILLVDSLPLLGSGKPDYVAATAWPGRRQPLRPQEAPVASLPETELQRRPTRESRPSTRAPLPLLRQAPAKIRCSALGVGTRTQVRRLAP